DVPARRGAAAGDLGRHIEERDEIELHAAPAPWLVEAEEPGAVQVFDRLLWHLAPGLGSRGALAQSRHEPARPAHRPVVVDFGEARARRSRLGHARMPAVAWGIFE